MYTILFIHDRIGSPEILSRLQMVPVFAGDLARVSSDTLCLVQYKTPFGHVFLLTLYALNKPFSIFLIFKFTHTTHRQHLIPSRRLYNAHVSQCLI